MQLTLDLTGRRVLVAGAPAAARRAVRRYLAAGAAVAEIGAPAGLRPDQLDGAALVSLVDDGQDWSALAARCARDGIPAAREAAAAPGGAVTLVGGGPGTDSLLTAAALDALREADVVLFDRLAPHANLGRLAPGAELIDVGKRPGHHPLGQIAIEDLMVARAKAGDHVVRLKGGDPFVFGRGGEEVDRCRAEGLPVRVVSGVTSAISVPAAAGIPVTYRGVSHLFTVVSGHAPLTDDEHRHLAGLGGTIVVLMGVNTLPDLTAGLRRSGMRPDMPVAVVERGYSDSQRTTVSTLEGIVTAAGAARCKSPAVLVIGDVVRQAAASELRTLADTLAAS